MTWNSVLSIKNLRTLKSKLDKNESLCGLHMDFSNVFDIIYHNWLVAKLNTYGFSKDTLTLQCSYLKYCKQNIVVISGASTMQTIISGVFQRVR